MKITERWRFRFCLEFTDEVRKYGYVEKRGGLDLWLAGYLARIVSLNNPERLTARLLFQISYLHNLLVKSETFD